MFTKHKKTHGALQQCTAPQFSALQWFRYKWTFKDIFLKKHFFCDLQFCCLMCCANYGLVTSKFSLIRWCGSIVAQILPAGVLRPVIRAEFLAALSKQGKQITDHFPWPGVQRFSLWMRVKTWGQCCLTCHCFVSCEICYIYFVFMHLCQSWVELNWNEFDMLVCWQTASDTDVATVIKQNKVSNVDCVHLLFYHTMHCSAKRGHEITCRLSFCLSVRLPVTLVDHDHIGWKSWKLIAQTICPTSSLFAAQRSSTYSQGNMEKFWENMHFPSSLRSNSFAVITRSYAFAAHWC